MAVEGYYGENVTTTTHTPGGWTLGAGRDESGYQTSGNGNNQDDQNNQTGETGSSEHKFEKKLRELEAKGLGDTAAAQVLKDYVGGITDARREELELSPREPGKPLPGDEGYSEWSEDAEFNKWAALDALQQTWEGSGSHPLYPYDENYSPLGVSAPYGMQGMAWDPYGSVWYPSQTQSATEGEAGAYETYKGSGKWVKPDINPAWQGATEGDPGARLVEGEWKKPILSGLGQHLFEQDWGVGGSPNLDDPTQLAALQDIQKNYYQQRFESSQPKPGDVSYGWDDYGGGGGGGGGGTGYYGDPRQGNPIERMANYYTPQANLMQGMINVHSTPTGFANPHIGGYKRGGIVSLLRLGS